MRTVRTICLICLGISVVFAIAARPLLAHAQTMTSHFEVVGTSIAETQQAIREGRTSCRAVVEGYLARIQAYDQRPIGGVRLNSIVTVNPVALAEADACDREFARTHRLPPLGG